MSKRIIRFIRRFHNIHGVPPTVGEISQACVMQPKSVWDELWRLQNRGRVRFDPNVPRSVRVLPVRPVLEYLGTVR
ncbi:LexA repressor [Symmachiella macrocystis]|uniref:LexA repressor n=1 Tax=Symmachiella macrocystis TaxID=2527985 RepID=A0A5C6BL11_9PLAN|nr:hypothetical protein [Symmachiella macrocystis]TWU12833.1 LexA repressor [Symmachiella macrocystis]